MMDSSSRKQVFEVKNDSTSNCESAGRNGMKIGVKTKKIEQNQQNQPKSAANRIHIAQQRENWRSSARSRPEISELFQKLFGP
jgi:hypothetical protein